MTSSEDDDLGQLERGMARIDELVAAGELRCAVCGSVITPPNEGPASYTWDEDGNVSELTIYCRECSPSRRLETYEWN